MSKELVETIARAIQGPLGVNTADALYAARATLSAIEREGYVIVRKGEEPAAPMAKRMWRLRHPTAPKQD